MSKTVREILKEQIVGPSPGHSIDDAEVDAIIAELAAAGLVIAPKEPTEAMIEAAKLHGDPEAVWVNAHDVQVIYRAMIAAAQNPK